MKDIPGYEDLYAVTEDGQIWSYPKKNPRGYGAWHDGKFLSAAGHAKGYLRVNLADSEGKNHMYLVHRLVAMTFIPNPDKLPQVNHKNGNKSDNRVENLEWCTNSQNVLHSVKIGTYNHSRKPFKESKKMLKKLSRQEIESILKMVKDEYYQSLIAEQFAISPRLVRYYKSKYPNGLLPDSYI